MATTQIRTQLVLGMALALAVLLQGVKGQYQSRDPDCYDPPDNRDCGRRLYRFHFNFVDRTCQIFVYGGCPGGTRNNFETLQQCIDFGQMCLRINPLIPDPHHYPVPQPHPRPQPDPHPQLPPHTYPHPEAYPQPYPQPHPRPRPQPHPHPEIPPPQTYPHPQLPPHSYPQPNPQPQPNPYLHSSILG